MLSDLWRLYSSRKLRQDKIYFLNLLKHNLGVIAYPKNFRGRTPRIPLLSGGIPYSSHPQVLLGPGHAWRVWSLHSTEQGGTMGLHHVGLLTRWGACAQWPIIRRNDRSTGVQRETRHFRAFVPFSGPLPFTQYFTLLVRFIVGVYSL